MASSGENGTGAGGEEVMKGEAEELSRVAGTGSTVATPQRSKVLLVVVSIIADLLMTGATVVPENLHLSCENEKPGRLTSCSTHQQR